MEGRIFCRMRCPSCSDRARIYVKMLLMLSWLTTTSLDETSHLFLLPYRIGILSQAHRMRICAMSSDAPPEPKTGNHIKTRFECGRQRTLMIMRMMLPNARARSHNCEGNGAGNGRKLCAARRNAAGHFLASRPYGQEAPVLANRTVEGDRESPCVGERKLQY